MVSIGRVCSEQQDLYSNQDVTFHGKLWQGIEDGGDIRKKGKVESAAEFVERMKKVHEEVGVVLKKVQEDMKRQADWGRKETEAWKRGDRVMLNTQDLVFKERPVRKLVDRYIGLYAIEEVVSTNAVKL